MADEVTRRRKATGLGMVAFLWNGRPVAHSRHLAAFLGLQHQTVLDAIQEARRQCRHPRAMFGETEEGEDADGLGPRTLLTLSAMSTLSMHLGGTPERAAGILRVLDAMWAMLARQRDALLLELARLKSRLDSLEGAEEIDVATHQDVFEWADTLQ